MDAVIGCAYTVHIHIHSLRNLRFARNAIICKIQVNLQNYEWVSHTVLSRTRARKYKCLYTKWSPLPRTRAQCSPAAWPRKSTTKLLRTGITCCCLLLFSPAYSALVFAICTDVSASWPPLNATRLTARNSSSILACHDSSNGTFTAQSSNHVFSENSLFRVPTCFLLFHQQSARFISRNMLAYIRRSKVAWLIATRVVWLFSR